jgi:thiamine transport system permease protein
MPVFVVVYGVQALLGPRGWLQQVAGGRDALSWLGPLGAVAVAHAYYNYGFAARMLHAALERRSRRLEEAAQGLGASRAQAFGRTTVPLLAPTFLAVALLVFLFCFASFGTVLLLGQGEVRTLETLLYGQVYSLFPDYPRAAVLGVLQLGLNAVLLASYLALRRRMHRLPREPAPVPPPASRTATAGSWLLVALAIAPMVAVLAGGFRLNGAWSLEPWRHLAFDHPGGFDLGRALGLSLFYALASTAAALALCAAVAYGAQRLGSWPRRAVEAAASLPMAASSVIVGLGMILAFGAGSAVESVFHYRFASTVWIVLAAQVVVGFPFAARALLPAFESHDTRLDEAASLLGASPRSIIARIHWPLFRGPLLVATGFCLAFSLGDFGASTMLAGTSTRGLAPWTNILDGAYNPLFHARATALAGLLGALAACAYLLVERAGRAAKEAL